MKKIILFFLLPLSYTSFCQEQQINCAENLQISQSIGQITYTSYPDSLVVSKYNNLNEVSNSSPEELMRSILSASSLEWMNFNLEEAVSKSSQDFEYIKNAVDSNYYFVLESKLEFTSDDLEYAVIKYRLHENRKIYGFAEAMIKIDDRWYTTKKAEINQILFFMGMVDLDYIEAIFRQNQTQNNQFNQVRQQYVESGTINLSGILVELEQSLSQNELIDILDPNRIFK